MFSTVLRPLRGAASPSPVAGRTGATLFNPKGTSATIRQLPQTDVFAGREHAPDFHLQAAGHEIGAAWKKTSEAGREYLSVSIDDPSFPATVYARLIENEDGTHDPIWSRSSQGSLTGAHRAPSIAWAACWRSTSRTAYGVSRSFNTASSSPAHRQKLIGSSRAVAGRPASAT